MIEHLQPGRLRRFSVLALVLALLAQLAFVVGAGSAAAVPCNPDINPNCLPPPPTNYDATITVTPPAAGYIAGYDAKTSALVFSCAPAGGTCSHTDSQQSADGYPTDGWPTYYFVYGQPAAGGYTLEWTGACSGTGSCDVTNDAPSQTLGGVSHDVAPPTISFTAPARVSATTVISASATDNSGTIAAEGWEVCPAGFASCTLVAQGTTEPTMEMGVRTAGDYLVRFFAKDGSGNIRYADQQVTYVAGVEMTSSAPTLAKAPTLTFDSTNEEAHVASGFPARECRAYPDGTSAPAWGACTTDNTFAPGALADGAWTLEAQETDDLGLAGSVVAHTVVDNTAPQLAFTDGPVEGGSVTTPAAGFTWTTSDPHPATQTCAVDAAPPVVCNGSYSASGYQNGAHTFTVTATDELGNLATITRHFTAAVTTAVHATASKVTVIYGHAATLSATVTPASATGSVRFVGPGGRTLCTATVHAGLATCRTATSLTAGTRTVTASYSGGYTASSAQLNLVVTKAATAVQVSAPTSVRHGAKLTVTAKGLPAAATGTVVVSRSGHTLCSATVSKGAAHCAFTASMARGTYSITVRYAGNANYAASSRTITVKVTS